MIIDDDRTDETDKMIVWRWNEGRAVEGIIASVFERDPRSTVDLFPHTASQDTTAVKAGGWSCNGD